LVLDLTEWSPTEVHFQMDWRLLMFPQGGLECAEYIAQRKKLHFCSLFPSAKAPSPSLTVSRQFAGLSITLLLTMS
jgi:hypothetical protein